jgi:hypothetical protein
VGIRSFGERVAPAGSQQRSFAPAGLALVVGAIAGGLFVGAVGGDEEHALAAPPPPPGLAAPIVAEAPKAAAPQPPRAELEAESLERPPGIDEFPSCMGDHGVNPRPRTGPWPRSQRPDARTVRRALRACLDRSPRLPVPPVPGRGG